jgi:hypothetical protein
MQILRRTRTLLAVRGDIYVIHVCVIPHSHIPLPQTFFIEEVGMWVNVVIRSSSISEENYQRK